MAGPTGPKGLQNLSAGLARRDAGQARRAGDLATRDPMQSATDASKRSREASRAADAAQERIQKEQIKLVKERARIAEQERVTRAITNKEARHAAEFELRAARDRLARQRESINLARKAAADAAKTARKTARDAERAAQKAEQARAAARILKAPKPSAAAQAAKRLGGSVGAIQAAREHAAETARLERLAGAGLGRESHAARQMLASRQKAGGVLGVAAGAGGMVGDLAGAAQTGGTAGTMIGGVLGMLGGPGGALAGAAAGKAIGTIVGALYEGGKKAAAMTMEASDAIGKMAGKTVKSGNMITDSYEETGKKLTSYMGQYQEVYADALKTTSRFGMDSKETTALMLDTIDTVRPRTEAQVKAVGELSKSLVGMASAMNVTVQELSESSKSMVRNFGKAPEKIQDDLLDMYGAVGAANAELGNGFDVAALRVDDLSRALLDQAKRMDTWNLNAVDVSKTLTSVTALSEKYGASIERAQKLGKAAAGMTTATTGTVAWLATKKTMEDALGDLKGAAGNEEGIRKIMADRFGLTGKKAELMLPRMMEIAAGNRKLEFSDIEIMAEQMAGETQGTEAQLATLQKMIGQGSKQNQYKLLQTLLKDQGITLSAGEADILTRELMSGGLEEGRAKVGARIAEMKAKGVLPEKKPPEGAAAAQFLEQGIVTSTDKLIDSQKELQRVTWLSADLLGQVVAEATGVGYESQAQKAKRVESEKRVASISKNPKFMRDIETQFADEIERAGGLAAWSHQQVKTTVGRGEFGKDTTKDLLPGRIQDVLSVTPEEAQALAAELRKRAGEQTARPLDMPAPQAPPAMTKPPEDINVAAAQAASAAMAITPAGPGQLSLVNGWSGTFTVPVQVTNGEQAAAGAVLQSARNAPR